MSTPATLVVLAQLALEDYHKQKKRQAQLDLRVRQVVQEAIS